MVSKDPWVTWNRFMDECPTLVTPMPAHLEVAIAEAAELPVIIDIDSQEQEPPPPVEELLRALGRTELRARRAEALAARLWDALEHGTKASDSDERRVLRLILDGVLDDPRLR